LKPKGSFIEQSAWSCLTEEVKAFIESKQFINCGPPRAVTFAEVWILEKQVGPTQTTNILN
jgi:hypothetical protein